MKACFLEDCESVNPVYLSSDDPVKEGIVSTLKIPAGTITEDPDCWMLCALGKAAPHDDECSRAVLKFLGSEKRKTLIANIKAMQKADGAQQLDHKTKKWLAYMEKSYAAELSDGSTVDPVSDS